MYHPWISRWHETIHQKAKEAVASGYWSLYRYNPLMTEKGKPAMTLDYKT